jgi:plasmid stability protein
MPDLPLRNIPAELYSRLQSSAAEHFRSLNQEVLARLSRSFDAEEAKMSALHARWVHEALASGGSTPLKPGELDRAFAKGVARAKARKTAKAA